MIKPVLNIFLQTDVPKRDGLFPSPGIVSSETAPTKFGTLRNIKGEKFKVLVTTMQR